jgi:hypothetical protein
MRTEPNPCSCSALYHIAPGWLGIWTAKPTCVRPPSGGPDISVCSSWVALRQSTGYVARNPLRRPSPFRLDYHTLCPDTNAGDAGGSVWAARRQSLPKFLSEVWYREHSPAQSPPPTDPQRHRSRGCVSCRFSLDQWGWAQSRPPKPRFAHGRVRRLPVPLDCFQVVALFDDQRPDLFEQTKLTPMLEVAMNGPVTAVDPRNMIPLTAGTHSKNDSVQDAATIDSLPTGRFSWVGLLHQRLNAFPQSVGHFPQGWHAALAIGHTYPLSLARGQLSHKNVDLR